MSWVRFPSPAPALKRVQSGVMYGWQNVPKTWLTLSGPMSPERCVSYVSKRSRSVSSRRFCSRSCNLWSSLVADNRPGGRGTVDVAADDLGDVLHLPAHDLGNDPFLQAGDVEPGRKACCRFCRRSCSGRGTLMATMSLAFAWRTRPLVRDR